MDLNAKCKTVITFRKEKHRGKSSGYKARQRVLRHDLLRKNWYVVLHQKYTFLGIRGGPVVRNLHSHCRGPGFNPWSGNKPKKKREREKKIQIFAL